MTKRAIVYNRVSSAAQAADDKVSLKEQLRQCHDLAAKRGYEVIADWQDIGPGTQTKRAGYRQLVKAIQDRAVDVVISWKDDRLFRGFGIIDLYKALKQNPDVSIELVIGNFDMRTAPIMAGVAQTFLDDFVERSTLGKLGNVREGRWAGGGQVSYGYRRLDDDEDGHLSGLAIVESEAEIVLKIFQWYAHDGLSIRGIVKTLNEQGVPTPQMVRRQWGRSTIARILGNPFYKGVGYYNRRQRYGEDGQSLRLRDEGDWLELEVPQIVPVELWEAVQRRRGKNRYTRRRPSEAFALLRGLLTCTKCGRAFHAEVRNGEMKAYRHRTSHGHCSNSWIDANSLDALVWDQVQASVLDPTWLQRQLNALREGVLSELNNGTETALKSARAGLEKEQARRDRYVELFADGQITREKLDQHLARTDAAISRLDAQIEELQPSDETQTWQRIGSLLLKHGELMAQFHKDAEDKPPRRRELLQKMDVQVLVDPATKEPTVTLGRLLVLSS